MFQSFHHHIDNARNNNMKTTLPNSNNNNNKSKSNSRGPAGKVKNVFGDDSDDDDDDDDHDGRQPGDARENFNKQLGKVQDALRQRAQAMMAQNPYEEYEQQQEESNAISKESAPIQQQSQQPERKSRYIADLLETANKRRRERETIYERKIAKQQALEDAEEDFAGKEKFITKAYRQKLEERKQWEAEEEERQRQEEAKDVTKLTTAGAAMANFYGNISKNVAMGGGNSTENAEKEKIPDNKKQSRIRHDSDDEDDFLPKKGDGGGMGFLSGFERSGEEPTEAVTQEATDETTNKGTKEPELTQRERRERKVAEARIRYLQRKGLSLEQ